MYYLFIIIIIIIVIINKLFLISPFSNYSNQIYVFKILNIMNICPGVFYVFRNNLMNEHRIKRVNSVLLDLSFIMNYNHKLFD